MTDEEVAKRYLEIATRLAVPFVNRERGPLPPSVDGDISAVMWKYGYLPAVEEILALGATPAQAARAKADAKALNNIVEETDLVRIPPELAADIAGDAAAFLAEEPDDRARRLDEKYVNWIPEMRVEIYSDEPKHRGRPHVAVVLADGKVSVSLEDPPMVLTPSGYRGEAAARKVVAKHRVRLLELWNSTRPTTQLLDKPPKKPTRRRKGRR